MDRIKPVLLFSLVMGLIVTGVSASILTKPPEKPDPAARYLFYLHGLIIENLGIRPTHPVYGVYEYEKILGALSGKGFTVISEARKKGTKVIPYAKKVSLQIRNLLGHGVPPDHITVTGASKGGAIAAYVSFMLKNKKLKFVIIAGLFEQLLRDRDLRLWGNVLSVHDKSDRSEIVPARFFKRSEGLGRHRMIITKLGVGHGLVYKPYREWIDPMVSWATGKK